MVRFTGVAVNGTRLQIVRVKVLMDTTGFTVIVTVKTFPVQLPEVGVSVYVMVRAILLVLIKVAVISTALVPVTAPVIAVAVGADQEYVVPAGNVQFTPLVGVTVINTPLQVVAVIGVVSALGLMVIVVVKAAPTQEPEVGVTV